MRSYLLFDCLARLACAPPPKGPSGKRRQDPELGFRGAYEKAIAVRIQSVRSPGEIWWLSSFGNSGIGSSQREFVVKGESEFGGGCRGWKLRMPEVRQNHQFVPGACGC